MKKVFFGVILVLALISGLIGTTVPALADSPAKPAPAINIEKLVSVDGGTTWLDADLAPGPVATFPGTVKFKVIVTNTGNVPLTSIVVTDTDFTFTFTGVVTSLAAGGTDESDILNVASAVGQHSNTATVFALYGSIPVTDSDLAHYYVGIGPSIDIQKLVSVDGGTTWLDADQAPGPAATFPGTVKFKVIVTNTGNVPLTSIVVTDTVFPFAGVVTSLVAGGTDESDILIVDSAVGQHSDTATVSALYGSTQVSDNDSAHYYVSVTLTNIVPPGWLQGNKTGWHGSDTPPGWSKGKKTGWFKNK